MQERRSLKRKRHRGDRQESKRGQERYMGKEEERSESRTRENEDEKRWIGEGGEKISRGRE